jgi:glycosyltransferase involved in cell wall biosynthesis
MSESGKTPLFSVIMPTYNQARYLGEAVRSVLAQRCGDLELIIVNDGSTDDTPRLLADLAAEDPRIVVIHQANAGPSAARTAAIARARADWLAHLDSDDLWYPHALETYRAYIAAHPDAQFLFGYRHRLNEDGSVTELPGDHQEAPSGTAELFEHIFISHLCACFRKDLYLEAGGYDPSLRSVEDYDLYLRMSLLCRFEPVGRATGLRRRHAGCISRATGRSKMLEAEVLRRFVERQGGRDRLDPARIRRRLGKLYHSAGRLYLREGRYRSALDAFRSARRYRPPAAGWFFAAICRMLLPFCKEGGEAPPRL